MNVTGGSGQNPPHKPWDTTRIVLTVLETVIAIVFIIIAVYVSRKMVKESMEDTDEDDDEKGVPLAEETFIDSYETPMLNKSMEIEILNEEGEALDEQHSVRTDNNLRASPATTNHNHDFGNL